MSKLLKNYLDPEVEGRLLFRVNNGMAFPLMYVGLYIAEYLIPGVSPGLNKTPVFYRNAAHSNPISCC